MCKPVRVHGSSDYVLGTSDKFARKHSPCSFPVCTMQRLLEPSVSLCSNCIPRLLTVSGLPACLPLRTSAVVRTKPRACTATAAPTLTTFKPVFQQIRPRGKMVTLRATATENRPMPADSDQGTRDGSSPNGFHLHFGGGRLGFGLIFPALV